MLFHSVPCRLWSLLLARMCHEGRTCGGAHTMGRERRRSWWTSAWTRFFSLPTRCSASGMMEVLRPGDVQSAWVERSPRRRGVRKSRGETARTRFESKKYEACGKSKRRVRKRASTGVCWCRVVGHVGWRACTLACGSMGSMPGAVWAVCRAARAMGWRAVRWARPAAADGINRSVATCTYVHMHALFFLVCSS